MRRLSKTFFRWVSIQLLTVVLFFALGGIVVDVVHGQAKREERDLELEHRVTRLETLYESNTQMLRILAGGILSLLGHAAMLELRRRRKVETA